MDRQLVSSDVVEPVGVVTLANAEKRNALAREVLAQLKEELERLGKDERVKVVVLRAEGKAFSAGHDLRELVGGKEQEYAELFGLCTEVMETIRKLPKPVIAEVQGVATAAGCQLVATCDLVVASEEATFATPGVKIGLFCTTPGVALARAVGPRKAMEMLLTGQPITAREAERVGLVNRVVPAEKLHEETMQLARQVAAASGETLAIGKRAFYEQVALEREAAYEVAQRVMVENATTADAQEGMRAFLEKREARWRK